VIRSPDTEHSTITAVVRTLLKTFSLHGPKGLSLLLLYYLLRTRVSLTGTGVQCPICGWQGKQFHPYLLLPLWVRSAAVCPHCGALERHRALYLCYKSLFGGGRMTAKHCLHFSPEDCLRPFLSCTFGNYLVSEYSGPGHGDVQAIDLPEGGIDVILAHHVLEHVEDDGKALSELHRVLKEDGVFYLSVPVDWKGMTKECGRANPSDNDHYRSYGRDIMERFRGFEWRRFDITRVCDPASIKRYGISEQEPIFELKKKET
jgi:SAM-dependent methyltransferase